MKTKETNGTHENGQRRRAPVASFEARSGAEITKALGGRRNPLIRLVSAKEIQGFSLLILAGLCWMRPGFG